VQKASVQICVKEKYMKVLNTKVPAMTEIFLSHKSLEVGRVFGGIIPVWSGFKYSLGILCRRRDAGVKDPVPDSVQG